MQKKDIINHPYTSTLSRGGMQSSNLSTKLYQKKNLIVFYPQLLEMAYHMNLGPTSHEPLKATEHVGMNPARLSVSNPSQILICILRRVIHNAEPFSHTYSSMKISTNFPKRLELSFLTVLAFPNDSNKGAASRI